MAPFFTANPSTEHCLPNKHLLCATFMKKKWEKNNLKGIVLQHLIANVQQVLTKSFSQEPIKIDSIRTVIF